MEKIFIGLFMAWVVYRLHCTNRDINNLYSSRDSLWREFGNEVQARKRQTSMLRQRVHNLREAIKGKLYEDYIVKMYEREKNAS